MKMRKSDRQVTDPAKIKELMEQCDVIRVGYNDHGEVYIVPLNFGFTEEDGTYTLYYHGAKTGRKMDLAKQGGKVGFEMDTDYQVVIPDSGVACDHTSLYRSIIGTGIVSVVNDPEEKKRGLETIMKSATGRDDFPFPEKMLNATGVFKIVVDELTAKEHLG